MIQREEAKRAWTLSITRWENQNQEAISIPFDGSESDHKQWFMLLQVKEWAFDIIANAQ